MESFDSGSKASGALARVARSVTGSRSKIVVVVLFFLLSGALLSSGLTAKENNSPTALLPDSADSTAVAAITKDLPSSGVSPAFVVISGDAATLRANDDKISNDVIAAVSDFSVTKQPIEATFSQDSAISLIVVPLDADTGQEQIEDLRDAVKGATPDSVTAQVTGGPAFQADLAGVFAGADVTLLITTASVVALLLLVTYRSPWLWLVPLTVVAIADRVAAYAVAAATQLFDYTVDGSTIGITSVLVFGAGTNYALLLIARYREELRRHEDRHDAMRAALGQAAPAILASAGTVVLALLMLSFAESPSNRALGYSGAIGIGVAVLYGLVMLPAAMVLFSRRLFWPFIPKLGEADPAQSGVWAKVGSRVVKKPVAFATGTIAFLVIMAVAGAGLNIGLSQNERFRETPEAVLGQETLARAFPAGAAEPTVVVTAPKNVQAITEQLQSTDNVASVMPGTANDEWAQINVVLESNRGTTQSADTVKELRETLGDQYGDDVLVGGADAQDLDSRNAAVNDFALIVPLVLLCVFAVLLLLLRSLVAAVVLVTTVVASSVSAFGIGWFISKHVFDFPALDLTVPLFAFIFLVALGVDYNIFLTTRAREEAHTAPVGQAMTTALAVTGGVITSAGILLAAVFAVLGVLPLITLTQIGVIVGLGVLIDTLFVRSLLVPALATLLGEKFWWPSHPDRERSAQAQDASAAQ